jgi:hypothetical protein
MRRCASTKCRAQRGVQHLEGNRHISSQVGPPCYKSVHLVTSRSTLLQVGPPCYKSVHLVTSRSTSLNLLHVVAPRGLKPSERKEVPWTSWQLSLRRIAIAFAGSMLCSVKQNDSRPPEANGIYFTRQTTRITLCYSAVQPKGLILRAVSSCTAEIARPNRCN